MYVVGDSPSYMREYCMSPESKGFKLELICLDTIIERRHCMYVLVQHSERSYCCHCQVLCMLDV